eukprot:CAMPEP_0172498484 /NCGR_PEP_ID=MMETSP1066-20121228/113460_1 /TAXON_ID=671091 /ORGANISM="Coscinodiscus wailesii, Strain CCMP2513" /LENGTH=886 /DNA_ID=CAMNT_0013271771 /DNA_START=53 /DNA_END=2713 /DNA_ORIENTATION=-
MKSRTKLWHDLIFTTLLYTGTIAPSAHGTILINEVAYSGSGDGRCNGEDWVELFNNGTNATSLEGYVLHDDKGKNDEDAMKLSSNDGNTSAILAAGEYRVLCKDVDFFFGIGYSDTVTLLNQDGVVVSTSGILPGTGVKGETYAYFPKEYDSVNATIKGEYRYTTTPTPGSANIFTERPQDVNMEEIYTRQNELGRDFFRWNDNGTEMSSSSFPAVIDLYVDMDANSSLAEIKNNPGNEQYVPFTMLRVVSGNRTLTTLDYGGRIRTKGQSTLVITACMGFPNVPFRIDFDTNNASQTLFGMETAYLRNFFSESSYMREYTVHRLNARFGLPYLRVRHVRLFFNGDYVGFYALMEAPDQAYVMQRSFGPFNPTKTALYKVKTMAGDCPYQNPEEIKEAEDSPNPDPYYFERGDHKDKIPVLGTDKDMECGMFFFGQIMKERKDIIKGFVENDKNCGLTMVNLGRIERDFGPKSMDNTMISFLNDHIYSGNSEALPSAVDTDQWIKNFASYAVTLNYDSPINNYNNFYLASTSGGMNDWRIVQWDHNSIASTDAASLLCGGVCGLRLIYSPILHPTCQPMETNPLVNSILGNKNNRDKYIAHVQDFINILSTAFFEEMQNHGKLIKSYVVKDPLNTLTETEYEARELSSGFEVYSTRNNPFIKTLKARKQQVQNQLDAIAKGTLPRNGEYGKLEVCPDWRDSNGNNYIGSSTFVLSEDTCDAVCEPAAMCYSHSPMLCNANGTIVPPECQPAQPYCDVCFPHSRCGTLDDNSALFVENNATCSPDMEFFTACKTLAPTCFDHKSGECAFDGKMYSKECLEALPCQGCFPNSRCAGGYDADEEEAPGDTTSGGGNGDEILSDENTSGSFQKQISGIIFFIFGFIGIQW